MNPKSCDVCTNAIGNTFVDGKTKAGQWANMCEPCHKAHGIGLGTGKGQLYRRNEKNQFVKVKG